MTRKLREWSSNFVLRGYWLVLAKSWDLLGLIYGLNLLGDVYLRQTSGITFRCLWLMPIVGLMLKQCVNWYVFKEVKFDWARNWLSLFEPTKNGWPRLSAMHLLVSGTFRWCENDMLTDMCLRLWNLKFSYLWRISERNGLADLLASGSLLLGDNDASTDIYLREWS